MSALPICEAAYMDDGRVLVGWSNRTEAGGFTVIGDITAWFRKRVEEDAARTRDMLRALYDAEEALDRASLWRPEIDRVLDVVRAAIHKGEA